MKIILLRHGKVDLPPWPWIQSAELGKWIEAYNSAGIRKIPPPDAAIDAAGRCRVIVTSDLLRSVESAKILGPKTPMISDGLFREAGLPYGSTVFVKMPPYVWAVVFRVLWAFGFAANGEPVHAFRERTRNAAMFLISLARKHESVLFAGHGLINRYIAHTLLAEGWLGPGRTAIRHWGVSEYTHEDKGETP